MAKFSDCFTWSDLDPGHGRLKLVSDKLFIKYPYLKEAGVAVGDTFSIEKMGGQETCPRRNSKWTHLKHETKGIEVMITRDDAGCFHHSY